MKYMGSKSRIAKYITPILQKYIDDNNISTYIEPFVGGANVIDKINCKNKFGSDKNKYLIALLQHVQDKKPLLDSVSKDLYDKVRSSYKQGFYKNATGEEFVIPDWFVGNVGFLASYNGRWFDGGYAKPGIEKTKNGERFRDYYKESKANILAQTECLQNIIFECKDYHEWTDIKNAVIYCDPPYQNTKQYANAVKFDYDDFWNTMRQLSKNNIVLISEENAPEDFEIIWKQEVSRSIKATDKSKSVEKLFKWNGKKYEKN